MNSVVLSIFFLLTPSAFGAKFSCQFKDFKGYNCETNDIFETDREITAVNGIHLKGFNHTQVTSFEIPNSSDTNYIPNKVCDHFESITEFNVFGRKVIEISHQAFEGCDGITSLVISGTKIQVIPENLLEHLLRLENLNLNENRIKSLPLNLLANSQILTTLEAKNNEIAVIEFEFDVSMTLVDLEGNICIQSKATSGEEIRNLNNAIDENCTSSIMKTMEGEIRKLLREKTEQLQLISDNAVELDTLKEVITGLNETTVAQKSLLDELLFEKLDNQGSSENNIELIQQLESLNKSLIETNENWENDKKNLISLQNENFELAKNLLLNEERIRILESEYIGETTISDDSTEKLNDQKEETSTSQSRIESDFVTEDGSGISEDYNYDDYDVIPLNDIKETEAESNGSEEMITDLLQNITILKDQLEVKNAEISELERNFTILEESNRNLLEQVEVLESDNETFEAIPYRANPIIVKENNKLLMVLSVLLCLSLIMCLILILKLMSNSRRIQRKLKDLEMKPTDKFKNSNYY